MENKNYRVFKVDAENKRIFITRKPIFFSSNEEKQIMQIDNHFDEIEFSQIPDKNPEFKASDYDVVDITDWEYENYEDLCYKVNNYEPMLKRK